MHDHANDLNNRSVPRPPTAQHIGASALAIYDAFPTLRQDFTWDWFVKVARIALTNTNYHNPTVWSRCDYCGSEVEFQAWATADGQFLSFEEGADNWCPGCECHDVPATDVFE